MMDSDSWHRGPRWHVMQQESLAGSLEDRLRAALSSSVQLVNTRGAADRLGDMEAIYCLQSLMLRIVRDRGQEFLYIAPVSIPDRFFQFGDVEIAMGWRTVQDVLKKRDSEPLETTLARLSRHLDELTAALSGDCASHTVELFERAAKERGDAFLAWLRGQQA